jgi:pilus assembly protein Flp/PilA
MSFLIKWFVTSIKREKGASAIEYALLAGLIAVAIITVLIALGGRLQATFQAIVNALTPAPP